MEISKARQSTISPHDYVWRLPLPASYPPPHTHALTPGFTRIYYLIFFLNTRIVCMYACMYVSKLSPMAKSRYCNGYYHCYDYDFVRMESMRLRCVFHHLRFFFLSFVLGQIRFICTRCQSGRGSLRLSGEMSKGRAGNLATPCQGWLVSCLSVKKIGWLSLI